MLSGIRRWLPPARMVWIALALLGGYGANYLGLGGTGLLAFPLTAVAVDLLFARIRFPSLRFPDAAIATGLFLALLLPPTVPLFVGIAAAVVAISVKHIVRSQGRPWFNPAIVGMLFVAIFGVLPAWWGSINVELVLALGIVLIAWSPRNWRLPVVFLGVYAVLAILERVLVAFTSGPLPPTEVLLLTAVDPAILFFGLFMVSEPRSAPADPHAQPLYAIAVAGGASLLPLVSPTLAPLLALAIGNLVAVALRAKNPLATTTPRDDAAAKARASERARARIRTVARAKRSGPTLAERWSPSRRATAAVAVIAFVAIAGVGILPGLTSNGLGALPPGSSTGPGGNGPAACTADNPSIPSATLSELHRLLGPSVILSYSSSSGTVVFYDPVNHVTVTEVDLYEDFGYAEFNGDDYAVAGCAP